MTGVLPDHRFEERARFRFQAFADENRREVVADVGIRGIQAGGLAKERLRRARVPTSPCDHPQSVECFGGAGIESEGLPKSGGGSLPIALIQTEPPLQKANGRGPRGLAPRTLEEREGGVAPPGAKESNGRREAGRGESLQVGAAQGQRHPNPLTPEGLRPHQPKSQVGQEGLRSLENRERGFPRPLQRGRQFCALLLPEGAGSPVLQPQIVVRDGERFARKQRQAFRSRHEATQQSGFIGDAGPGQILPNRRRSLEPDGHLVEARPGSSLPSDQKVVSAGR